MEVMPLPHLSRVIPLNIHRRNNINSTANINTLLLPSHQVMAHRIPHQEVMDSRRHMDNRRHILLLNRVATASDTLPHQDLLLLVSMSTAIH